MNPIKGARKLSIQKQSNSHMKGTTAPSHEKISIPGGSLTIFLMITLLSLIIFATMGCKEKGPAEKAGQKIDESLEKAGDKLNDLLGK